MSDKGEVYKTIKRRRYDAYRENLMSMTASDMNSFILWCYCIYLAVASIVTDSIEAGKVNTFIVGGDEVEPPNSFPYMVTVNSCVLCTLIW